jgi:hypothetical protein
MDLRAYLRPVAAWSAMGLAALLLVACLTHHPDDRPSNRVLPAPDPPHNAAGKVGAHASYHLKRWFGPGCYVLVAGLGAAGWLAWKRVRVREKALRVIGLGVLAASVSTVAARLGDPSDALPTGSGGLVGIVISTFVLSQFGTVVAAMVILAGLATGLALAADDLIAKLPAMLASAWKRAPGGLGSLGSLGAAGGLAGLSLASLRSRLMPATLAAASPTDSANPASQDVTHETAGSEAPLAGSAGGFGGWLGLQRAAGRAGEYVSGAVDWVRARTPFRTAGGAADTAAESESAVATAVAEAETLPRRVPSAKPTDVEYAERVDGRSSGRGVASPAPAAAGDDFDSSEFDRLDDSADDIPAAVVTAPGGRTDAPRGTVRGDLSLNPDQDRGGFEEVGDDWDAQTPVRPTDPTTVPAPDEEPVAATSIGAMAEAVSGADAEAGSGDSRPPLAAVESAGTVIDSESLYGNETSELIGPAPAPVAEITPAGPVVSETADTTIAAAMPAVAPSASDEGTSTWSPGDADRPLSAPVAAAEAPVANAPAETPVRRRRLGLVELIPGPAVPESVAPAAPVIAAPVAESPAPAPAAPSADPDAVIRVGDMTAPGPAVVGAFAGLEEELARLVNPNAPEVAARFAEPDVPPASVHRDDVLVPTPAASPAAVAPAAPAASGASVAAATEAPDTGSTSTHDRGLSEFGPAASTIAAADAVSAAEAAIASAVAAVTGSLVGGLGRPDTGSDSESEGTSTHDGDLSQVDPVARIAPGSDDDDWPGPDDWPGGPLSRPPADGPLTTFAAPAAAPAAPAAGATASAPASAVVSGFDTVELPAERPTETSTIPAERQPQPAASADSAEDDAETDDESWPGYRYPETELLEESAVRDSSEVQAAAQAKADALERALPEFGVDAHVVGIDTGPVVTMFELELAPGVKINKIAALESDLARALKAPSARVVAPLPNKSTIGLEVPNTEKDVVRLRELLRTGRAAAAGMQIPLFLGKDASGRPLVHDLSTMPHLLIAGSTGSGKSVCINAVILSILMTRRPDEVKLVLVDPKIVELAPFRDVPHLMCPVVTDAKKAEGLLEWAVAKMEERYELLAEAGVRNIAGYNRLGADELYARLKPAGDAEAARIPKKLPALVIVIDELADLMMTSGKQVETHITRLAQKSRAVGIHLIVATQRPSVDVITGLIKANMPARIAFRVASRIDSRTILDQRGADLLLGQGDMLFLQPGTAKLVRAQGAYISDEEVRRVTGELTRHATPRFARELVQLKGGDAETGGGRDPLFDQAVEIVLETRRGSVSLLQRRLTVGYTRAARLIDQMAEAGIVGEYRGSAARDVMMTLEDWKTLKGLRDSAN